MKAFSAVYQFNHTLVSSLLYTKQLLLSFTKELDVAGSWRVAMFGFTPVLAAVVIRPVTKKLPLKVHFLN